MCAGGAASDTVPAPRPKWPVAGQMLKNLLCCGLPVMTGNLRIRPSSSPPLSSHGSQTKVVHNMLFVLLLPLNHYRLFCPKNPRTATRQTYSVIHLRSYEWRHVDNLGQVKPRYFTKISISYVPVLHFMSNVSPVDSNMCGSALSMSTRWPASNSFDIANNS